MGPTMDHQIIRDLFANTAAASRILGEDIDLATVLSRQRSQIAPNQIGKHGQLQEWLNDEDVPYNAHRHMSPLWALYPGGEITPDNPKLFNAARLLLTWRGEGSTGWSYAWRIPLWARVSDGDLIHADQHGAVVIPHEVCGDIKQAANLIARRERVVIAAAQQPGFDVEALRRAQREAADI